MVKFRYSAIRKDGIQVSGTIDAIDREAAVRRLDEQGQHPIDIGTEESNVSLKGFFRVGGEKISFNEITIFTREISWLLRAGVSLSNALAILANEAYLPKFSELVETLRIDIRKGRTFHEALALSEVFGSYYTKMVEVGEVSGTLPAVLDRIYQARKREEKIRNRMVSALIYPSLLLLLAAGAVTFIFVQVVPSIKDMILSSGAPVPSSAQFVISLSDWLIANGLTLLVATPLTALLVILAIGAAGLRRGLQRIGLRLPLIGDMMRKSAVLQFCRLLGTLLAAGVNLPESLRLMRPSLAISELQAVTADMEKALRKGGDFLAPLERSHFFPHLLSRMMRVGNETGNLTQSLELVTNILEDELDRTVERSLTLLEPLIILLLSVVVAAIIVSLMTAIISVNDLAS